MLRQPGMVRSGAPFAGPAKAMALTRIIFADDDQLVLGALRKCLRRYRNEWDMRFVTSGDDVLKELERADADVVVTDMRMPGMQGQTLLQELSKRHPDILRLVFSGSATRDASVQGMRLAHQYLAKPTPVDELYRVIHNLRQLQTQFTNPLLQRAIGAVDQLPVPGTYSDLTAALANPDASMVLVAQLMERESTLTQRVTELWRATGGKAGLPLSNIISHLGVDTMNVLTAFSRFEAGVELSLPENDRQLVSAMRERSKSVAAAAYQLLEGDHAQSAYLAGLLHDVGGLVLMAAYPEHRAALFGQRLWPAQRQPLEKDIFGFTHAEVGAYLLGAWCFAPALTQAVAGQHAPVAKPNSSLDETGALYLAQRLLMERLGVGRAGLDPGWLASVGLMERLDQLSARVFPRMGAA